MPRNVYKSIDFQKNIAKSIDFFADKIELALQLTMKILQTAVRMMKDLRVRALLAPVNVRYMYWSEVKFRPRLEAGDSRGDLSGSMVT